MDTYRVPVRITQVLTYEVQARNVHEAIGKVERYSVDLEPVGDETLYIEADYHSVTKITLDKAADG